MANTPKRWALLCGGNWYAGGTARQTDDRPPKRPPNLNGCVGDVEAMRNLLLLEFQVPEANIRMLTATTRPDADEPHEPADRWPTWENIKRELQNIEDEANKDMGHMNRLLYFHYSGHGTIRSSAPKATYDDDDGSDIEDLEGTALVMTDVTSGGRYLNGRQLGFWIKRMVKKSGFRATVVLDSCYSGHGLRHDGNDNTTSRTLHYDDSAMLEVDKKPEEDVDEDDPSNDTDCPRDADGVFTCWLSDPKGCAVVTACSKLKTATETTFNNQKRGVLTYWLVEILSKTHNVLGSLPSHTRVVDHIRRKTGRGQIPAVYGDGLFEFFGLTSYVEGESCNATLQENGLIGIDIGSAQGVVEGAIYNVVPADISTNIQPGLQQIQVTANVRSFQSTAKLLGQDTPNKWSTNEVRNATLHQWALPEEVTVHWNSGNAVDRGSLEAELSTKPGLVLGNGVPSGRDLVISLDKDDIFEIRQHDNLLPRLPKISITKSSWALDLAGVLSHVSRFQALQHLFDHSSRTSSILPQEHFKFTSDHDQVENGKLVKLSMTYSGEIQSLWVSLYEFSASWGVKKLLPSSGTAAQEVAIYPSEPIELPPIRMNIPPKCRESDPDEIEDHFYLFVSTSGDGKIPSWGSICLPSLRPTELADPMEWANQNENDEERNEIVKQRISQKREYPWTVIKKTVVTSRRSTPAVSG